MAPGLFPADWNFTTAKLTASGWLNAVGGIICSTGVATCNSSELDFFVMCLGLYQDVVAVFHVCDAGFRPHSPIRVWFRGRPRSLQIRALVAPLKIPANLPPGCLRQSQSEDWDDIVNLHAPEGFCAQLLSQDYVRWMTKAELDFADMMAIDGKDRENLCVRKFGPKFVFRPALSKPGSCSAKVSAITLAWKSSARWLADILKAFKPGASSAILSRASRAKWHMQYHCWDNLGNTIHASAFLNWANSLSVSHFECKLTSVFFCNGLPGLYLIKLLGMIARNPRTPTIIGLMMGRELG